jgi:predicted permease
VRDFIGNLKFGVRLVRRQPAVSALVVLTMSLGIGVVTAVFSLADAVLLEPLPYAESQRLVTLRTRHPELGPNALLDEATYGAIAREARSLDQVAATVAVSLQMEAGEGFRQVDAALATPSLFDMLPARPAHGRAFSPADGHTAGRPLVALLSHRLWRESFGADPGVLGRSVRFVGADLLGTSGFGGELLTVVGVLPAGFKPPFANLEPQVWIAADFGAVQSGTGTFLLAYGRLRDGVAPETAAAELAVLYDRVQRMRDPDSPWRLDMVPLRESLVGDVRRPLLFLLLAGLLVLVVAAANTANVLAGQIRLRRSEAAVRAMLGADRRHLFGQFLAEGTLVSALAGGLGLGLAATALRLFRGLGMVGIPRRFDVGIDWSVLAFVALVTLGTNLLLAMVPVLRLARLGPADVLQAGTCCATSGRNGPFGVTARLVFVSFQVCMALTATVAAVLLLRSFHGLVRVDPGFAPQGVATAWIALPESEYPSPVHKAEVYGRLLERLRGLPDVAAAGLVNYLPFSSGSGAMEFAVEGAAPGVGESTTIEFRAVSPDYPKTMQIPLLAGRYLDQRDLPAQASLVSAKAARLLWGGRPPLGQRLKMGGLRSRNSWMPVVGVLADVRHDSLTEEAQPVVYVPFLYFPQMAVAVRSQSGNPEFLGATLDRAVRETGPRLPLFDVQSMEQRIASRLAGIHLISWLTSLLAAVALGLAAVGIYAVLWRTAVERTSEFRIRFALGATRGDVVGLMLRKVVPYAGAGLVAGIVCSLALSGSIASLLFGITPADLWTFSSTTLAVGAMAVLGVCLPTWRVARPVGWAKKKRPVLRLKNLQAVYRAILSGILTGR